MKIKDLNNTEYNEYFYKYILLNNNNTLKEELEISLHELIKLVKEIPMEKFDFSYEEGKWTIKEIIQHIIDSERIFTYRALRISRKDQTNLTSFDEDFFIKNTNSNSRSLQDLLNEFSAVRYSTLMLFNSFSDEQLCLIGNVNSNKTSVRAIGFVITGHQKHHLKIFQERYLN